MIGSDPPAGTTLKPDASSTSSSARARKPIKIRDWIGKDADRAEQAWRRKGLEVDRDQRGVLRHRPRGRRHLPGPAAGRTLFRATPCSSWSPRAPSWSRCPAVWSRSGVEAPSERLEALGFEVDVEEAPNYLGLGFVFRVDPAAGTMVPKGSTITLYHLI